MSLARRRQRRARLDLHAVRRDRRRAGWLGGVLQRGRRAAASRCRSSAWSAATTRSPSSTRLAARGIDWSGVERVEGESFRWKGKYSYDLQSRETLETRLGVFASFEPKLPDDVRGRPSSSSSATSIPSCSWACWSRFAAPARGVRHDELLDREQEVRDHAAAQAGRPAHGQRQRGAGALGRLEHSSRRRAGSGRTARSAS